MTSEQRDLVHHILRTAPFDLGGDVAVQRPLLTEMLTAQPLPADVRTELGELGGVPAIFIEIDGVLPADLRATPDSVYYSFAPVDEASLSDVLANRNSVILDLSKLICYGSMSEGQKFVDFMETYGVRMDRRESIG